LATGPRLVAAARAATGHTTLVPARYGYKYYRPGDFMAVHRDSVKCHGITISFPLSDSLGPMGWLPKQREATSEHVAAAVGAELFPTDGQALPLGHGLFTGFDGYNIPHWRPPYTGDAVGILGTICYLAL
jgi:hypothetical protein